MSAVECLASGSMAPMDRFQREVRIAAETFRGKRVSSLPHLTIRSVALEAVSSSGLIVVAPARPS
jgi:hypothetical protein